MGHTNSTVNYNLPQFVGTDKPSWLGDINNAFSAIDTAIASAASTATTADGKADALGTTVSGHTTQIGTLSNTVTAQGGTLNSVTALIGNGTPTTTDQTIIGAINELNADITNKIGHVDVNVTGTEVTRADGSWYYCSNITVTIPSESRLFTCTFAGVFATGVFPIVNANNSFILISDRSLTMPTCTVRCWYVVEN